MTPEIDEIILEDLIDDCIVEGMCSEYEDVLLSEFMSDDDNESHSYFSYDDDEAIRLFEEELDREIERGDD